MENEPNLIQANEKPLKLNYKRIFLIGFAFFGILLMWQVYDSWCPTLLQEMFKNTFHVENEQEVQYLVGIMMALDNLAALIMMPIFGKLSDKTHTKIGKRMPYILVGTFVCAIAFPFIPVFYHYNNVVGMLVMMAIVVFFAMMYRNPAVALMPDMTPKPLRSKANGIINIMGYIGGLVAVLAGIVFVLSDYLAAPEDQLYVVMAPFLIGSVFMIASVVVLFCTIKENKIAVEVKEEMDRGEALAETVDRVDTSTGLSKKNRLMLILILVAEFFWFMADNGVGTFLINYSLGLFHSKTTSNMFMTIFMGVGSVVGFLVAPIFAQKMGRKKTLFSGLSLTLLVYVVWVICSFTWFKSLTASGEEVELPWIMYVLWLFKGFGMSLVHVNSFPMIVELCTGDKIGKFTGYYYASSMAAQTVTPVLIGLFLLSPSFGWEFLPVYASVCMVISLVIFFFVPNVKLNKTTLKKGLEALDQDD